MSLTKYFLSLSMLLGLGLAANAQTWQEPGGSVHSSEARYVVSANTTGCSTDLDYTNPSASNAVYTYTGAGMTVEQGQSFDLHVTSAEYMVWCHAVVFVDWNCDYDFDDEGEQLFKVGSDVDDSDAPSDLVANGNPEVVDFTRTITVPADAAVGTTRMRIQFTDAWHIKGVDHPDHSAMDAVDKGGVYDFDVTITEAATPVEGPTLVIGEHTNGQILVYTTDGEGVKTFYEDGETLPLGWITAQFVADDGYTLQTPYFGSMDLTGSLEADNTFSIEVVEGTETVSFSAVFVEEAVEPEPSGWTIVAEHTMSGTSRDEVVEANVSSASRTLIASCAAGGVNREPTQSGYALLEGLPYCWGVGSPYPNDYVGYTVAVEETGTYKFSFQTRLDGTSTSSNATVELRYVEDGGNLSYESAVSASQTLPATTALPGTLLESNELELTAGTTYDFVVYVTSASANGSRLFIGDFKLYKKGAAPVEQAPLLTWATPENGTIAVTVAGETVESGVEVATGTEVVVTFTPAEGYELETVTLGGEDATFLVSEENTLTFEMGETNVEIAATFTEIPVILSTLTWAAPENGTISVTVAGETVESGAEVEAGTEVVATFTPAEGYELETVTLGGEDVTTDVVDGVLTFAMGEEDVELAATFAETSTPEPADNLTAIQLTGASNTSTHSMFYFSEDDYGHGAEGNFYNGRSGNLTMSVWVNIHEAQGALMGYGQRWYNPEGVFTLSFDNGYYKLRNRTATEDHTNCADPQENVLEQAVETDTWAFVTVVFDTDNLMRYVYYNGEVVFEDVLETGGLGLLPDDCIFFVSNGVTAGWYFNSPTFDLDEVQVWDKALSADEVRASMTSVDPAAEGLISLYRFGADRMNEDYTFDNLASAGSVTAALYTGSMYSSPGSITSNVAEPTFVEGHIAEAPENYEVTWTAPENGTLTIMNGDVELTSGALVAEGTELTVIAAPAFGYQLDAVTVNDETLEGTTFTVTGATVVAATFTPVQLEEWPHDTTGQAANGNPSVHPSEDRYVTSATTTGAAIDLNWTNSERPSTWYINTGAMMQAEQGTTFDLRMQSAEDMIWCHAVIFVDWNGDKDFDDEGEMIAKVGLDHVDDGAGGSFFQTGNPGLTDFTQTIEVPATATVGTTCIRVMYTDAWHDTNKGHSHSAMDAVDKGGIYDFYIDITEGEIVNTLTVEAEHATVRVRDYNTLEDYSAGTVLETGTQLLVSAEAEAGYEVTSVTVNGEEWPSYEPYTVDGPVHVVATTEALPMCTVNYTFEGEEYGSMTVYDASGFTMEPIENGGSVEVGGAVNVMVTMNDNVEGTITVNGGEPVEFDSTTWEGLYTQRINITEDMETLDIAVVLTEAKAPENFYDFTYTIEGEELLDEITIGDAMTGDPIESGASLDEGTRVGVLIYYAEGVDLTITINDVEQDIADNVVIMDGKCMYYGEITMDQDINLGIVLSQGTEPEGHTVTYALTGEAASAGTVYVNDMTDHSLLESGDTVADGADVNVQVTFDDQTVVGEMFVNGVSVGTFEYADNAGLYNYVVENVTADIDIEIELSYGNGIDSNLADGLKVYPTVFDEAVTVETPVDGSVTVYDMSGAAVYTAEVFEGSNSLPLGSLADGHYTLRVEGAGQSATVRVVKK